VSCAPNPQEGTTEGEGDVVEEGDLLAVIE
jgi:hypothetical protein